MHFDTVSRDEVAWYAVWTRSRHEAIVHRELNRRGVESFLPTFGRLSRWRDRTKKIDWPLFPGYCFARFNDACTLQVLRCVGVLGVVSFGGKLVKVSDDEINSLRRVVDSVLAFDPCPLVHEGMLVEIVRGPLKGVVGRLIRKSASRASLLLSVEVINQAVKIEVEAEDINPK